MSANRFSNVFGKRNHVSVSVVEEKDSSRCALSNLGRECSYFKMVEHFTNIGNHEQPGSPIRQKEYEINKSIWTVLLERMVCYTVVEKQTP